MSKNLTENEFDKIYADGPGFPIVNAPGYGKGVYIAVPYDQWVLTPKNPENAGTDVTALGLFTPFEFWLSLDCRYFVPTAETAEYNDQITDISTPVEFSEIEYTGKKCTK